MWNTGGFSVIELPWPGEKRYPHEGWEHIEIVLPGEPETLNARALALLSDEGLSQPGIVVKTSAPQGEHETFAKPDAGRNRWPGHSKISSVVDRSDCRQRTGSALIADRSEYGVT
ncbi:Protein yecM [Salmonella bongori]|nr:Protein yecM [Salmonella bongori]